MVDSSVRQFFNSAENWLVENLPASPLRDVFSGALLLVRRTLFNQAPLVIPSSPTTSELDGTISGRIGAYDDEGDALIYTVVGGPEHGTVEVDADGRWTYTPGEAYDPEQGDSFDVIIDAQAGRDRTVTIQAGEQTFIDAPDVAVRFDASGRLTVTRNIFGQHIATVTLRGVTSDTEAEWLDSSGRLGGVTFGDVVALYPSFEAVAARGGDGVDLTLEFDGADGSPQAALLDSVEFGRGADGSYVFTGRLAPTHLDPRGVDPFDVVGKYLHPLHAAFLDSIDRGVELGFNGASVYLDTMSTHVYSRSGLYASDSEANPPAVSDEASAEPAGLMNLTASAVTADAVSATSAVTASLSLGRTVVISREDGSVEMWTDGEGKQLQSPKGFGDFGNGTPNYATSLLEYNRPLKDDDGNTVVSTFTGYISGTTLTVTSLGVGSTVKVGSVITGAGVVAGTKITKFVEQTAQCADTACTATIGTGAGGSDGYPGTYEVSVSQSVGSPTQSAGSTAAPGITFSQTGVPAVERGFVVGTATGTITLWSAGTGWTPLGGNPTPGYRPAKVTAMATFGEGVVTGFDNGSVWMWRGPDTNSASSTWKDNWTILQDHNGGQTYKPVTAIVSHGNGIVVAYSDEPNTYKGTVRFYDPSKSTGDPQTGWTELLFEPTILGYNSPVAVSAMAAYGTGVVVGMKNGSVRYWDGTIAANGGWTELRSTGWNQEVSALLPYESGVIVGLGGKDKPGAVEYYTGGTDYKSGEWHELHGTQWGSAVTKMIPYRSDALGDGVVVGLANGSVHMWNGPLAKPANASDTLNAGNSLKLGETLYSNNGGSTLTLQRDGNLVLRQMGKEVWASGTAGKGVVEARLQAEDRNFVLYTAAGVSVTGTGQNGAEIPTGVSYPEGEWTWEGYARGWVLEKFYYYWKGERLLADPARPAKLVLQDDGNAVLYAGVNPENYYKWSDYPLWETYTASDVELTDPKWRWWTELHNSVWDTTVPESGVAALVPVALSTTDSQGKPQFADGVIVGLGNGSVEQWSGKTTANVADWLELATVRKENYAAAVLARKGEFTCADWQCSSPGALQDAVNFANALAPNGFATPGWNSPGGVGGASDPIFSNAYLKPASEKSGVTYAIAAYKKIQPDKATLYEAPKPSTVSVTGYIKPAEDGAYPVLYATGAKLEKGNLVTGANIQPGTEVAAYIKDDGAYSLYRLTGLPVTVGGPLGAVSLTATKTPSVRLGGDVILAGYGYVHVPDSFLKFTGRPGGGWSFGFLTAGGGGVSIQANLGAGGAVYAPAKDVPIKSFYAVAGPGLIAVESGVKLSASLSANGASQKKDVSAHAYYTVGLLTTYNTVGAPGEFQFGGAGYGELDASDFKDITGATLTGTVAPYVNLAYGWFVPNDVRLVGGLSVAKISGGVKVPISVSACVDATNSCPATTVGNPSAGIVNFYGVINDGTFNKSSLGAQRPNGNLGKVLTVTQDALYSVQKAGVGQVVTGPGVKSGTKITAYKGSSPYGEQWYVDTEQLIVGEGSGKSPKMAAYLPGSVASVSLGYEGLATFHAGVFDGWPLISGKLAFDTDWPLASGNVVVGLESALAV